MCIFTGPFFLVYGITPIEFFCVVDLYLYAKRFEVVFLVL